MRNLFFRLLENSEKRHFAQPYVNTLIVGMIILNSLAVTLATVESYKVKYLEVFSMFEKVSVLFFTLEYLLRIWVCVENKNPSNRQSVKERLRYILTPFAIIDLVAILPYYLGSFIEIDLRFIRAFRLIRILRFASHSITLQALGNVFKKESKTLLAALFVMLIVLFTSSAVMYYLEKDIQPVKFGSIPDAMWWGVAALTTVGFGDTVPISVEGKILAGIIMMLGIVIYALPAGIFASAFVRELKSKSFFDTWNSVAKVPILKNLDASAIGKIVEILEPYKVRTNRIIDTTKGMYFIISGVVNIKRGEESKELTEGEFFGEMEVLFGGNRNVVAKAKTPVEFLILEPKDFREFLDAHSNIREIIKKEVEQRLMR
jgi:voltage-gated potassium channel